MEWAVDPYDAAGNAAGEPADVLTMSLGPPGHFEEFIEPTRNLYLAGVFPAIAVGNNCGGASASPGNVYEAVAVGATDGNDDVASFSCGEVVAKSDWSTGSTRDLTRSSASGTSPSVPSSQLVRLTIIDDDQPIRVDEVGLAQLLRTSCGRASNGVSGRGVER